MSPLPRPATCRTCSSSARTAPTGSTRCVARYYRVSSIGVPGQRRRAVSRVGIVYPRANLDTVPSLVGAAEAVRRARLRRRPVHRHPGRPAGARSSARRAFGCGRWASRAWPTTRRPACAASVKRAGWLPNAARAPLAARLPRAGRRPGAGLATGGSGAQRAVAERAEPFACVIGVDPDGLALAHDARPRRAAGLLLARAAAVVRAEHAPPSSSSKRRSAR